jgi:predicted acylesterase/phospholipase RssA
MARIKSPDDVEYLSFQGGGGKGFAYLGAVEALEGTAPAILPVGDKSKVKGISGASAGAIVSTLLTLGATSDDLRELFRDTDKFLGFFDAPKPGYARAITPEGRSGELWVRTTPPDSVNAEVLQKLKTLRGVADVFDRIDPFLLYTTIVASPVIGGAVVLLWSLLIQPWGKKKLKAIVADFPFLGPIVDDPVTYAQNLLLDRGLFPGFAARVFLVDAIAKFVKRHSKWKNQLPNPGEIRFDEMFDLTGVDLVITGTNITQRAGFYFSKDTTPQFSVAEAVGISSCFPIVFKPVWIKASRTDPALGPLRGGWVDGGLMNNFPIRAFDLPRRVNKRGAGRAKLNPRVLGFTLQPGAPQSIELIPDDLIASESALVQLAAELYETALSPANLGQLATAEEADQVIPIFTYTLSLFDFGPSQTKAANPLESAHIAVNDYFARHGK